MQKGQNVIFMTKGENVQVWGRITELAEANPDFSYHSLKSRKFPFTYKKWIFRKVKYRTANK